MVVAITFLAIYRQLTAQQSANIFEQLNTIEAQWQGATLSYQRLYLLIELEGRPIEEGSPLLSRSVVGWFENLATLLLKGRVDTKEVAATLHEPIPWSWTTMKPYIQWDRRTQPRDLAGFEELAARMAAIWVGDFGKPYQPLMSIGDRIDGTIQSIERKRDIEQRVIPERQRNDGQTASG